MEESSERPAGHYDVYEPPQPSTPVSSIPASSDRVNASGARGSTINPSGGFLEIDSLAVYRESKELLIPLLGRSGNQNRRLDTYLWKSHLFGKFIFQRDFLADLET
ncbi:hypothetical protein K0M31_019097 [Melipona bicolor]|uniref:Uncharacterized protein n=1 Tax=Melipona bicolor TaxID=60889 RepID=A0AA40G1R5_9HYME|nr:hypothetical protein K0M31_019097 [Melipona bicolor]